MFSASPASAAHPFPPLPSSPHGGLHPPLWLLAALAVGLDAGLVAVAAALAWTLGGTPTLLADAVWGGAVALLLVLVGIGRRDYAPASLLDSRGHGRRALLGWSIAVAAALAIAAMSRSGADLAGAPMHLFLAGALLVPAGRALLARSLQPLAKAGMFAREPTLLVGFEAELAAFSAQHGAMPGARRIVGAIALREDTTTLDDDLALAVAVARVLRPADVLLLLPWRDRALIERSVDVLRQLPAAIHLGAPDALGRYAGRLGTGAMSASVPLVPRPLSPLQARIKRAFDITAAGFALLACGPLLLAIAVAIRLDSRGPVLFFQRRYGFNQQPFRIVKFRTMTTLEDDARLRQARAGDERVTRVGRLLRRTSLDELPQLFNVLKGDMSLIGPRPHALAHDRQFERVVDLYGRRFTMRPGITGLAQVCGFRGETDTREKIEGRIALDLAYIDNWSLWSDLSILIRTVLSPATFRNAR